jgi:hypothetical protein
MTTHARRGHYDGGRDAREQERSYPNQHSRANPGGLGGQRPLRYLGSGQAGSPGNTTARNTAADANGETDDGYEPV